MADKKKEVHVWERQTGETQKAFAAFCIYRNQPKSGRSIKKAAQSLGKHHRTLEGWSAKYKWIERVKLYDDYMDTLKMRQREDDIKDAHEYHRGVARVLIEKLEEKIKRLEPDEITAQSVPNLLRVATEVELRSLGELSNRVEIVDDRSSKVSLVLPKEETSFKDADNVSIKVSE